MIVLSIIMPPGVAPVFNRFESWAILEELSIASISKKNASLMDGPRLADSRSIDPTYSAAHMKTLWNIS